MKQKKTILRWKMLVVSNKDEFRIFLYSILFRFLYILPLCTTVLGIIENFVKQLHNLTLRPHNFWKI